MTERLIFDLETNGLLDTLDTIHCIGIYDLDKRDYRGYKPRRGGQRTAAPVEGQ